MQDAAALSVDEAVLAAVLRRSGPQRLLELGPGWAGTRARKLSPATEIRFHDGELWSLDAASADGLQAGDVLFVETSGVSKTGSDVHRVYFDVLPRLAGGVTIGVRGVFLPFQYPYAWVVDEGRNRNEQYLLAALLTDSTRYRVLCSTALVAAQHPEASGGELAQTLWFEVAGRQKT
jgi:hypothetical protein